MCEREFAAKHYGLGAGRIQDETAPSLSGFPNQKPYDVEGRVTEGRMTELIPPFFFGCVAV